MKILVNNYKKEQKPNNVVQAKPYPRNITCEHCGSALEYDKSDLRIGVYGCAYLDCPCCGKDNMIEDDEMCITLTKDNIEFPVHFHNISMETGAVDCCNNEHIKEYIQKAIEYFRNNKDEYDWGGWMSGNLYLHVHRWSGDGIYEINISNNFYNGEISFESVDY